MCVVQLHRAWQRSPSLKEKETGKKYSTTTMVLPPILKDKSTEVFVCL